MKVHVILAVLAVSVTGAAANYKYFRCTYGFIWGEYHLPTCKNEMEKDYSGYYFYVDHDQKLNCGLYSYQNDPRVIILFDSYGNLAGLRVCFIKEDVFKQAKSKDVTFAYKFDDIPMFSTYNYWGFEAWCTTFLFVSPKILKAGGRNCTSGEVEWSEVWIKLTGCYVNISTEESGVEKQGFTKQGCSVGLGMHYFYGLSNTTDCSTWSPVFLTFEKGKCIGVGLWTFGSHTSGEKRDWFESPGSSLIKKIAPNRPDCVLEYLDNFDITSLHIFFKNHPMLTYC